MALGPVTVLKVPHSFFAMGRTAFDGNGSGKLADARHLTVTSIQNTVKSIPSRDEFSPPSIAQIKMRLMVLWANSGRAFLELEFADDVEMGEEIAGPLREWVSTVLRAEATEAELARHQLPLGSWDEQTGRNDSWDREGSLVLQWGLGLIPVLTTWDTEMEASEALEDFFDFPNPQSWRPDLKLRAFDELDALGMRYETCLWRSRRSEADIYTLKLMSRAHSIGTISLASDGDLALSDGRSFASIDEQEAGHIVSIVQERLEACNWICGHEPNWDLLSPDTVVSWLWDETGGPG
jgi:hypothetical protein